MTFGLILRRPDASVAFDSRDAAGGVPIALHTIASGSGTVVYSWASLAGLTIKVMPIVYADFVDYTIDYALGYPRVTYNKRSSGASVSVVLVM